jgi:hypothetical protein
VIYVQELIFNVNDDECIAQHDRHLSASAAAANVGSQSGTDCGEGVDIAHSKLPDGTPVTSGL